MRADEARMGASRGVALIRASGEAVGRSNDGVPDGLAGSVAAESTPQHRRGISGGRGLFGQCSAQQTIARSSVTTARGAATAIRVLIPTATSRTQIVSRFRDTKSHCMCETGEWQPARRLGGRHRDQRHRPHHAHGERF